MKKGSKDIAETVGKVGSERRGNRRKVKKIGWKGWWEKREK